MSRVDTDKARKHGLDEFVQANPSKFDHHDLFSSLQRLTLVYRLNDNFACLVRIGLHKVYRRNLRRGVLGIRISFFLE